MKRSVFYICFGALVCLSLWISGCKTKQICPAYQSAFYLDVKIAEEQFSPFDKDSLPKMEETVRKTDVLLVLRLGKKRIDKRMAVIPMITIFPEQADSALAMADSLGSDSTLVEEDEEPAELADSTNTDEETAPEPEPESPGDIIQDEEPPKPLPEAPKPVKKLDAKDPELSDPTLKAEFEESFEDSFEDVPKEADLEEPPPPEPEPKKKAPKKKGPKKAEKEADKPKEPEPEEDKF